MVSILQNSKNRISVFAPISIGNVSVGFDSLGLAVTPIDGHLLGDIVHVEESQDGKDHLDCGGKYQLSLPAPKEANIIWQCLLEFNRLFEKQGGDVQKVCLTLEKNTPICSGLGSSACSVVAGLKALNEFYNNSFPDNQLLKLMGKLEEKISGSLHYDNVAPCFLGGLQLMHGEGDSICQSLPTFGDCYWIMSYPNIEVSTRLAREILPESYSRQDLITYGRRLAGFIDASYRQDKQQAFSLLEDIVAEPYRISLLKNYTETKAELLSGGCLAVGISGSGPTVFAVCDSISQAEKAKQIFDTKYLQNSDKSNHTDFNDTDFNNRGFTSICKIDTQGARRVNC